MQFPPLHVTVDGQMADYRERIAERIKLELGRRGEQPRDLAYRLDVSTRTVERWLSAERKPQGRHLKAVSDDLGVPIEELNPDLEAEEQAIRDWMERIEEKLDEVLRRLSEPDTAPAAPPSRAPKRRPPLPIPPSKRAPRKRAAGSG